MGKKKPQKTKELSVAIAEASSAGEQPLSTQTPRKRGRPRKIVIEKTEAAGDEKEAAAEAAEEIIAGHQSKKAKTSEEVQEVLVIKEEGPSDAAIGRKKEEAQSEKIELLPRRSSRRKSKPRKSS